MGTEVWNQPTAQGYDAASAHIYAPEVLGPTVDFLAQRAGHGPALEFAIGTGRVALALRDQGVPVAGIELSESMVAELRNKPGGSDIPVSIGDMASTRAPGEFRLVYLVYNAITCLLTQDQQVECFRNAARHLQPGGCFVIEVFVPELQRLPPGEIARPFHVGKHHLGFDTFDLVNQRLVSHHYWIQDGAARMFQSPHRYVWPSELDLMAKLAGLELRERWADWNQTPFTADSTSHVSVWKKPHSEHQAGRAQPSDQAPPGGQAPQTAPTLTYRGTILNIPSTPSAPSASVGGAGVSAPAPGRRQLLAAGHAQAVGGALDLMELATEPRPVRGHRDAHRWPCCDRPSLGCCPGRTGSCLLGVTMRPVRILTTAIVVAALTVIGCTSRTADQTATPASTAPSSAPTTQPTAAPTTRSTAGSAGSTATTVTVPATASCALSPNRGPAGSQVVLSCRGFAPAEGVEVSFGATVLTTARATTGGEVAASFAVPSGFAGSHYPGRKDTFQAKGRQSGTVASATFTVTG